MPVFETVSVRSFSVLIVISPNASAFADSAMSGTTPTPLIDTVAGLFAALCVIVKVPDFDPIADGVKLTVTDWLCPAATLKEVGEATNAASLEEMALTTSVVSPVLETVNVRSFFWPTRTLP